MFVAAHVVRVCTSKQSVERAAHLRTCLSRQAVGSSRLSTDLHLLVRLGPCWARARKFIRFEIASLCATASDPAME